MIGLNVYQIIALLFAFFFILDRITKFIRKEPGQTLFKTFTIVSIFVAVTIVILDPTIIVKLNERLGGGHNFNTLIFIVFILVFAAILKLLNITERIERHITELVRNQSLTFLKTQKRIKK
jgi:hypothetical protein